MVPGSRLIPWETAVSPEQDTGKVDHPVRIESVGAKLRSEVNEMVRGGFLVLICSLALACGGGGGGGSAPVIPPDIGIPDPDPDPDPDPSPPRPEFIEDIVFDQTVPIDFGTRLTPFIEIAVPSDTISITVESFLSGSSVLMGIQDLTGPAGRVYVADRYGGDYTYREEAEIFSATIPNTDIEALGVFAGEYRFRLYVRSSFINGIRVRIILERRAGAVNELGQLPLNVWLAAGIPVNAGNAATDSRLQDVIREIFRLLNQNGVEITRGDIDYYDISNPDYDSISISEFDELCRSSSGAKKTRLNLFFVREVFGDGVVGASATVSGPKRNGTRNSGVAVDYTGVTGFTGTKTIGGIAAHEIGHFLGLYHTVESDGTHDIIEDTAECPANGTSSECSIRGGGLLMHWEYLGAELLTPGQGLVLRSHPIGGSND